MERVADARLAGALRPPSEAAFLVALLRATGDATSAESGNPPVNLVRAPVTTSLSENTLNGGKLLRRSLP